jgi:hypothetical protein
VGRFGSSVGLFYCCEVNTVKSPRGGVIASSGFNPFGLKLNCKVKSHRIQKVKLVVGNMYIIGIRKEQALLEPSLDVALLPKEIDPMVFVETSKPSNVWKAFFTSQSE